MFRPVVLCAALTLLAMAEGKALLTNPMAKKSSVLKKNAKAASGQKLDSNFWGQSGGETYANHAGRYFKPSMSSTFSLIKLNNVNVTFLDNTNLRGYDGADMATLGKYKVDTRMGMIEHCNSRNFDDVDGILGFGWADQPRSAALLKTLTQTDRPGWSIHNQPFMGDGQPMPRKFAFTADNEMGELHLGGYDPKIISSDFAMFPMSGQNVYGIDVHSITYGGVELLQFDSGKKSFVGEFDSGTTCLLLPNTDVKGNFSTSPFGILAREQGQGKKFPLVYHAKDVDGNVRTYEMSYTECVEPTDETMIMGDPFFRKFVVLHDLVDLNNKKMGLAPRAASYRLGAHTDRSILTPGHAPHMLAQTETSAVTKVHATRKHRDAAFVQALHETKKSMARSTELAAEGIDKVAVKSQSMVTYNIQLAIGSPPQPLDVIFDTGSFMLAVFAEKPPAGMTPLLKDTPKKDAKKAPAAKKVLNNKAAKIAHAVRSHVARMDMHTEQLAQMNTVPLTQNSGLLSGGSMAAGLAACSAFVLAGILLVVRRRESPFTRDAPPLEHYGTC